MESWVVTVIAAVFQCSFLYNEGLTSFVCLIFEKEKLYKDNVYKIVYKIMLLITYAM